MTQLQQLTQFTDLFEEVFQSLQIYNTNLRNELFEIEPNENTRVVQILQMTHQNNTFL